MSGSRHVYTVEQLLALQYSPLIKKPENLPRIEQWIESSTDQGQRRPRTQGVLQNGKGEDNDQAGKRATPFEGRPRQGQPQSGDDIFLGPKMSFASASAARQSNRKGFGETGDKSSITANDETRDKYDRFGARDRIRRDGLGEKEGKDREQDSFRNRFGRLNGLQEEADSRAKRAEGKETRDGGVTLDGQAPRRTAPLRSRIDQPWYRDGNKLENKEERRLDDISDGRGWRDSDRRNNDRWNTRDDRQEQDPKWMAEPAIDNAGDPTQEDFQKWKERMKAGSDPKAQVYDEPLEPAPDSAEPLTEQRPTSIPSDVQFLGIWGEPSNDAAKPDGLPQTPKAVSKPKASRFANMFKDAQAIPNPAPPVESPPQQDTTPPAQLPPKNTAEDHEGFERMMQMLRMGGSSSQGPQAKALRGPGPAQYGEDPRMDQPPPAAQERSSLHHDFGSRGDLTSPIPSSTTQQGPRSNQNLPMPQRPPLPTRDSSFLLKLMQQPPSAHGEGQIYGRGYERKESNNGDSAMTSYPPSHPDPRSKMLPPGFPSNDSAGPAYHIADNQFRANESMRFSPHVQMNDRFGGPMPRYNPGDEPHMQQRNMFDQFAPPNNNRGNPQQTGPDNIPPPPGFSASRGQAPPGFFNFPGNGPIAQQQPQQQPQQQAPQQPQFGNNPMQIPREIPRGPMQPPNLPPGFYDGQQLPPGLQMQMVNPQQNRGPQMRQGPLPQGQEGYRQAPPPMQSQGPPHYLKQMGGGYTGM